MFNPPKIIVIGFYVGAGFEGLWVYENNQDHSCVKISSGFVATFSDPPLLWVSKLQTYITISILHSKYVALSLSIRDLLPLNFFIKNVVDKVVMDIKKFKFFIISSF